MEDLHYAGGLPAVHEGAAPLLHVDAATAWGQPIGAEFRGRRMLQPRSHPHAGRAGESGVRDLGAEGQSLPQRRGDEAQCGQPRRCSFTAAARSCSNRSKTCARASMIPASRWTRDSVLVLKGCGPKGYPGMPEVGNMPLPRKLLEQGVEDMLRISDARMSGTAFGAVVLHVAPEVGGRRAAGPGAGRR